MRSACHFVFRSALCLIAAWICSARNTANTPAYSSERNSPGCHAGQYRHDILQGGLQKHAHDMCAAIGRRRRQRQRRNGVRSAVPPLRHHDSSACASSLLLVDGAAAVSVRV